MKPDPRPPASPGADPTASAPLRRSPAAMPGLPVAALLLLAAALLAFWPPYLSRIGRASAYAHAHAVLGSAWLLLLVLQPALVRLRRIARHRAVGRVGVVVGVAFIVSGVLLSHQGLVRMSDEAFAREGRFVYLPLLMAALFAAALALALRWRHVPALHARFMACTLLPLLDPVLARLLFFYGPRLPDEALYQLPAFVTTVVVLGVLLRSLPRDGAARRTFRHFALGVVVALASFFVVPDWPAWQAALQGLRA